MPEDRGRVIRALGAQRPYVVVGCPPCTDWCGLNARVDHPCVDRAEVAERKRKVKVHLEFVANIYLSQLER
eukprot:11836209-Alexandrium_andersonii.AAC.1